MKNILTGTLLLLLGTFALAQTQEGVQSREKRLIQPDSVQVAAWLDQAFAFIRTNVDSLEYYSQLALDGAIQISNTRQIGHARFYLGKARNMANEGQAALDEYLEAMSLFRSLRDTIMEVRVLQELAGIYFNLGRQNEATEIIARGIRMARKIEDLDLLAKLHHRAGNIYQQLEQNEKALHQHRRSLFYNRLRGSESGISANYNNIGNAFVAMHQEDSALFYYEKALVFKEENNDVRGLVGTLSNIGNLLVNVARYEEAEEKLNRSCELAQEGGFLDLWMRCQLNLAFAMNLTGRHRQALSILEELQEMTDLNTDVELQIAIQGSLAESYRLSGRFEEAMRAIETHYLIKDSVAGLVANAQMLDLENQLAAEVKARELASLEEKQRLQAIQLENRKVWMGILLSVSLAILLLAALIYQRFRRKKAEHDRLEELNQFRSRFFANISHEIRTPLSILQGSLQRHQQSDRDALPDEELARIMERSTRQLLDLNNQLLELSRLEAGKLELKGVRLPFPGHLLPLASAFQPLAREKGVWLSVYTPDQPGWWIQLDRNALARIVNNLLSNALKHTPDGGEVRFRVGLNDQHGRDLVAGEPHRQQWPQAGSLWIEVKDTGRGIPESELPHIFDRFYRVQESAAQVEGTGLGLSLVKELVDLQDGQIQVDSRSGKGSRFLVTLPTVIGWELEAETDSETIDSESRSEEGTNGKALVLVVEDDPDLRQQWKRLLGTDYQVLEAADGEKGLELALAEVPDLVLSDLMMPRMNGLDLCRALRSNGQTSHIPFVLLTGESSPEYKMEGLEGGVDDYLQKPVHPSELQLRIRNLLAQRQRLREKWIHWQQSSQDLDSPWKEQPEEDAFLSRATDQIQAHLDDTEFDVETFAREMGMSRTQVFRKLKALTGQGPSEFIRNQRLEVAAQMLRDSGQNVSEVLYAVGFSSPSYFSRCFRERFGVSPSEYTRQDQD